MCRFRGIVWLLCVCVCLFEISCRSSRPAEKKKVINKAKPASTRLVPGTNDPPNLVLDPKRLKFGPPVHPESGICAKGAPVDPSYPCDWVTIKGGEFMMGSRPSPKTKREGPRHLVKIKTFDLWRTEITVDQYQRCVDEGDCLEPVELNGTFCNGNYTDRGSFPVNCIDWLEAKRFCEWLGGRLPSESEWEYAARSGGMDIRYPWGNASPTCDRAVIDNPKIPWSLGCYLFSTWPTCSKPAGNSKQGLCDLSGNVYEWVEDWVHYTYRLPYGGKIVPAPDDGSPWLEPITRPYRVMRGGGVGSEPHYNTSARVWHPEEFQYGGLGVRCARDH